MLLGSQFASQVRHGGNGGRNTTWSPGQRVLLAGAPGHVDTECYTLRHLVTWTQSVTCWASGHEDTECYLLGLTFLSSCRIWAHGMLLSTLRVRLSCSGKPFRNSLHSHKYVSMVTLNLIKLVVRFNLNLTQFHITRAQYLLKENPQSISWLAQLWHIHITVSELKRLNRLDTYKLDCWPEKSKTWNASNSKQVQHQYEVKSGKIHCSESLFHAQNY